MAKKAKRRVHQMPPLSVVDLLIYWGIALMIAVIDVSLVLFPFWYWYRNAFRDETVLAAGMTAGILWSLISWFVVFITTFVLWYSAYEKRLPIFGKRNFKYGPPAWPKVYPVFMKNKPYVWVSKRAVQERRKNAIVLLILVAVSFIPYPLSWHSRDCLQKDGSICQYNAFNRQVRNFSSGEIEQVEFNAYVHRISRRNLQRIGNIKVTLTTESGRRYIFDHDEFRGCFWNGETGWLPAMLELKDRYRPEIITYTGTDNLERVAHDNQLTAQQKAMLYDLFEP